MQEGVCLPATRETPPNIAIPRNNIHFPSFKIYRKGTPATYPSSTRLDSMGQFKLGGVKPKKGATVAADGTVHNKAPSKSPGKRERQVSGEGEDSERKKTRGSEAGYDGDVDRRARGGGRTQVVKGKGKGRATGGSSSYQGDDEDTSMDGDRDEDMSREPCFAWIIPQIPPSSSPLPAPSLLAPPVPRHMALIAHDSPVTLLVLSPFSAPPDFLLSSLRSPRIVTLLTFPSSIPARRAWDSHVSSSFDYQQTPSRLRDGCLCIVPHLHQRCHMDPTRPTLQLELIPPLLRPPPPSPPASSTPPLVVSHPLSANIANGTHSSILTNRGSRFTPSHVSAIPPVSRRLTMALIISITTSAAVLEKGGHQ